MNVKTLFSPEKIGNVEIKNRIVRSATYTHSATNDGFITDEMIKFQGLTPIAPSAITFREGDRMPKELTIEEIEDVIKNFIDAGRRTYESGYDLVQLNSGHGRLLSNFLSPFTNRRSDEFGGNMENRMRILVDIYNGIVDEIGKNFPITVKLQTQDFVEEGITLEESKSIAKILVDLGFAAIEPSGGSGEISRLYKIRYPSLKVQSQDDENYFLPAVKELKPIMKGSKIILMGGVRNPLTVEKLLREKTTDFIAMSRPLICEPGLPNRWKSGDISPPLCNSCNSCYFSTRSGIVACTVKEKLLKEKVNS